METLKSCPFCGGEADNMRTQASPDSGVFYYVFCICGADMRKEKQ